MVGILRISCNPSYLKYYNTYTTESTFVQKQEARICLVTIMLLSARTSKFRSTTTKKDTLYFTYNMPFKSIVHILTMEHMKGA